jgi:predicted CXXCH cytochrome family protein
LLDSAQFPSGVQVAMPVGDALCGTCHSGLSAGSRVDTVSEGFTEDEVIPDARFITPHYAYAAANWLGSEAGGGYEYPDKVYVGRFEHAYGVETCTQCHDPHSTRIRKDYENDQADLCAACHSNVTGYPDYKDIYVKGADYDGDGLVEGTYHEIEGVRSILYQAIEMYAKEVIQEPIGWTDQNPYLFKDANGDGKIDESEATRENAYTALTPRLMRAAFNYQFSIKDPAAYVHNGKYIIQLMVDAIQDLSGITGFQAGSLVRP